ncbi:MAG: DUF2059 domain-containing protein [Flavobacteriaceae bacterium]
MKKMFTLLLVVAATQFGLAQNDAFKQDAVKVIEKSGAGSQFEMVLDQIKTMVPEEKHEELTKDFKSTLPALYSKIAEVYMEEFSHNDIKQILGFYESEVGKKLSSKQEALFEKSMSAGEQWGLDLQVIMMKYME